MEGMIASLFQLRSLVNLSAITIHNAMMRGRLSSIVSLPNQIKLPISSPELGREGCLDSLRILTV